MQELVKYITMTIFCSLIISNAHAQILTPVHWSYASKKISKNEAVVFFKATIDDGWHIYSINQKDGGPVKTSFTFSDSKAFQLEENVTEPKAKTIFDKTFQIQVDYFENSVIFQQKVRLTGANTVVKGKIRFMTCNDQKCLPPDEVVFKVPVK